MDKIRWNQLFTPRTLKRGYELYQSGAVEGIQHNDYAIKGTYLMMMTITLLFIYVME